MGWRGIMGGSGRQRNMPRCMRKWRGEGPEEMALVFICRPRASRIRASPCLKRRLVLKAQTAFMNSALKRLIQLLVFASLALLARVCFAQGSEQMAVKQAITLLRQQIGLDNAAPNERNPKGLRIQFQKIADVQLPEGHSVRYRLLIPGAPEKQSYTLAVWRIGAPVQYTPGQIYTNAKGLVMWHLPLPGQEKKVSLDQADEIEVDLKAARGEPIRYKIGKA